MDYVKVNTTSGKMGWGQTAFVCVKSRFRDSNVTVETSSIEHHRIRSQSQDVIKVAVRKYSLYVGASCKDIPYTKEAWGAHFVHVMVQTERKLKIKRLTIYYCEFKHAFRVTDLLVETNLKNLDFRGF